MHTHTFIRINEKSKPREGVTGLNSQIDGAIAGCIDCGEIRVVFVDGEVRVLKEGHADTQ